MEKKFVQITKELELIIQKLEDKLPEPWIKQTKVGVFLRHHPKDRNDLLASYLKLARIVSLLNASICLIDAGFVNETFILARCIDESAEEIMFLALRTNEETLKRQKRLLNEFYQEELKDPEDSLSNNPRDRVRRDSIHGALSSLPSADFDPSLVKKLAKSIAQTFSGYVHGSYVSIVEMYDGRNRRLSLNGLKNTPQHDACIENYGNNLHRALNATRVVCGRLGEKEIAEYIDKLINELDYFSLEPEAIEFLKEKYKSQ